MAIYTHILATLCLFFPSALGIGNTSTIIRFLGKHSDHRVRPLDTSGAAVKVNVSMVITNLHTVSQGKSELVMDLWLRRTWNDPRLKFVKGPPYVPVIPEVAEKVIWMPEVYFTNAHQVTMHQIMKPSYTVIVTFNGDVTVEARLTVSLHCPMNMIGFPLDSQTCSVFLENQYASEDVQLFWKRGEAVTVDDRGNEAFSFTGIQTAREQRDDVKGTFDRLKVDIGLQRSYANYIILLYLPSLLLVLLSCLLFWLPVHALLERTLFSIFMLLVMTIIIALSQYLTPQTGYLKAIDVWVMTCFVFLLVCVLEVIILFLMTRATSHARSSQFELMNEAEMSKGVDDEKRHLVFLRPASVRRLDIVLRVIYPIIFIIFVALYFIVFHA